MEAEKSQDLQLASWEPRRAIGIFPSMSTGLRTRRANGISSSLKASRPETQEVLIFQFESKGRK